MCPFVRWRALSSWRADSFPIHLSRLSLQQSPVFQQIPKEVFSVNGQFYQWIRPQAPASRASVASILFWVLLITSEAPVLLKFDLTIPPPLTDSYIFLVRATEMSLSLAFSLRGSGQKRFSLRVPRNTFTVSREAHKIWPPWPSLATYNSQNKTKRLLNQLQYVNLMWTLILTNRKQTP